MSDSHDAIKPYTVTSSPALEDYNRKIPERPRHDGLLFAARLRELGVICVVARYDGCGDSGFIEDLICWSGPDASVELTDQTPVTRDQLTNFLYDLIHGRHPGWDLDEGAFGELTWDLTTNALNHTHTDRFTSYQSTEHEDGL